ncbi:hypothetical protein AAG906_013068 [Vitis piasezkii]
MRKTSLGANACSASFVRRSAQAWALNPLRFFSVQLRHCLTADGLDSSNIPSSQCCPVLMGCNVLDMLYRLDFTLLEVLFVYIVNMSQNERFSLSAHIPSLQLVTRLPDSNKKQEGWLMEWVEKAYFAWLNKLFEISSFERNRQVLLMDKNLHAVVKEEEEDMIANLRVGFKERQHKRLSKSITIILPPSKRHYPKILFRAYLDICIAPRAPSREEIVELMKQIPSFTEREAPMHNMEHAQLFKWLEVVETMRTYIAHNMGDSEELRAKLKLVEGELVAAWKMTDEGARLLRKAKEGRRRSKLRLTRWRKRKMMEAEEESEEETER